ncbi:phosphoenolpyruvate--protein phosphotransferase [Planctomycetota bacterium]|nr:phosphoenolpyruvate--protein phosphotransferase [Planctomycetota bacterium]
MMQIKRGIPVSPGVAIYSAFVLDAEDQPVPRRMVAAGKVDDELIRMQKAVDDSISEIEGLREQTANSLGEELAKIFSFHIGVLADQQLIKQIQETITTSRVSAEYAVYVTLRKLASTFAAHDSQLVRKTVSDVRDLERRILKHLVGSNREDLKNLKRSAIVVAHDLTPSQTATLDKKKIKALITDAGGRTSHTAILAHALGIPAIVGLEDITADVSTGDTIVVDGNRGMVVIDPDAAKLMEYRAEAKKMIQQAKILRELHDKPAVTKDGTDISLQANIEFPEEIHQALSNGAGGIGLYRTEFLYLAADTVPTEQQQYETYVKAIQSLEGRPLTIRTLDLGADKVVENLTPASMWQERNPFLGCRSIRLCLQNLPLFKTQLRAILRASVEGPVKIMFPLISNVMELRQAKMILSDVKEDLDDQGIPYRDEIPVGMMIEVPSAALQALTFAHEVDFFSIGTNDLIQYTVAVDRGNERIASLYSAAHPAVITLIKEVIRAAQRAKIDVSLCGEMASDPEFTMLLIGLGLRTFSITPPALPEIKQLIRSVSVDQCRRVSRKVSGFDSNREVLNYLKGEAGKIMPEVVGGRSIGY